MQHNLFIFLTVLLICLSCVGVSHTRYSLQEPYYKSIAKLEAQNPSSVAMYEYQGFKIQTSKYHWSWNYAALYLILPLPFPYPKRIRYVQIFKDDILVAEFTDEKTTSKYVCGVNPLPTPFAPTGPYCFFNSSKSAVEPTVLIDKAIERCNSQQSYSNLIQISAASVKVDGKKVAVNVSDFVASI